MSQKEIIELFFDKTNECEIPNSEEECEVFDGFIDYLIKHEFISSQGQKDERYLRVEDMLMRHYYVSLKQGFEYGFKTAIALLTQGE